MFDVRPVLFVIGILLTILAGSMLVPGCFDLLAGDSDWRVFLASACFTAFVGIGLCLACNSPISRLGLRQAFLLTTLAWIVVTAFGAIPFTFSSLALSYTDAYFETMSGLTTTGSSVVVGLDKAPHGVLLWRSLLHWIGGIGIIAIGIAILPMLGIGGMQLFRLESSDKSDKVLPRARQIASGIAVVYVFLTFLCAGTYWAGGMTGFEAINHAMATLATGGFSTSDSSFGKFDSVFLDAAGTLFMLCGGMTFTLFLRVQQGEYRVLWRDPQTQTYFGIFLGFTVLIALWLVLAEGKSVGYAIRHASFTVASIQTTTGFASTDYAQWASFPIVMIFMLTFIGACSGSTAGGVKVFRFQVMFEIGLAQMRRAVLPSGVFIPRYNRKPISDAIGQSVFAFVTLYVFTWSVSAALLGLCGLDLVTALTGAATALANVGPGLGETIGPAGNFATLPASAKWILSLTMMLGRLELITVFVLFSRRFWTA